MVPEGFSRAIIHFYYSNPHLSWAQACLVSRTPLRPCLRCTALLKVSGGHVPWIFVIVDSAKPPFLGERLLLHPVALHSHSQGGTWAPNERQPAIPFPWGRWFVRGWALDPIRADEVLLELAYEGHLPFAGLGVTSFSLGYRDHHHLRPSRVSFRLPISFPTCLKCILLPDLVNRKLLAAWAAEKVKPSNKRHRGKGRDAVPQHRDYQQLRSLRKYSHVALFYTPAGGWGTSGMAGSPFPVEDPPRLRIPTTGLVGWEQRERVSWNYRQQFHLPSELLSSFACEILSRNLKCWTLPVLIRRFISFTPPHPRILVPF